jgi:phage anti-repressor protein
MFVSINEVTVFWDMTKHAMVGRCHVSEEFSASFLKVEEQVKQRKPVIHRTEEQD